MLTFSTKDGVQSEEDLDWIDKTVDLEEIVIPSTRKCSLDKTLILIILTISVAMLILVFASTDKLHYR